ncbi:recombination regulator RecX [Bacillaceae bacterium S4-13-56]
MKITKISTQKKKRRYNIFVDKGQGEEFGFGVDEDILIEFHLQKGMELDSNLLKTLEQKNEVHQVFSLAINFLSYRMRTIQEMVQYLRKKEVEQDQIDQVINRLKSEGYLNDAEFAASFVATRKNTSGKGPILIKKELMDKGVEASIIENSLTLYSREEQLEKAMKLIEKKIAVEKRKSHQQALQTVKQTLLQKGFTQDIIQEGLQNIELNKDSDEEWNAIVYQGEKAVAKYQRKYEGFELKQKVKTSLYQKGFTFDEIERFLDTIQKEMG